MKGEGYAELTALIARVGTLWRAVTALLGDFSRRGRPPMAHSAGLRLYEL